MSKIDLEQEKNMPPLEILEMQYNKSRYGHAEKKTTKKKHQSIAKAL